MTTQTFTREDAFKSLESISQALYEAFVTRDTGEADACYTRAMNLYDTIVLASYGNDEVWSDLENDAQRIAIVATETQNSIRAVINAENNVRRIRGEFRRRNNES